MFFSRRTLLGVGIAVALVSGITATEINASPGGNDYSRGNSGNVVSKPSKVDLSCTPNSLAPKGRNASFLVEFKLGVTDSTINSRVAGLGAAARKFNSAGVGVIQFNGNGQSAARLLMRQLGDIIQRCEDDQEITVAPNSAVRSAATQSPVTSWGLDRIDQRTLPLNNSYSYTTTGSGVDVYIVDTGVLSTHTEFAGRIRSGFAATGLTGGTQDCNGHGTHVAGTAAGATYGVAPFAIVVPVRVLDCNGSGTLSGVISGIDWAIQDHTTTPAVMNLSLGGGLSGLLDAAVQRAVDDGITVVVAAGNSNANACNYSPAAAPNAITVAATTSNDFRSSFSNYGDCVDIFAPGSAITSAWHTSTSAKNTISGTSMASPHVAGVAARVLSANATFTPAQVVAVLQAGATTNIVADSRSLNNLLLFADPNTAVVQPPSGVPGDGTGDGDSGTVITVPAEPNAPVATAGDRSARLQWTNNDDGGSSIIGHLVRVFEGTKLVKEVSVNARTDVTITGLKARTTYTFRIAAINSIGRSTFSPASNEVTPVRVVGKKIPKNSVQSASQARPGSARSVKTQVIGSRLSVSWRYAKQDVGTNVDFVILIRSNSGKIARLVVSDWQGVTLTGLERGTYNIRVRAFNSFGAARATKVIATRVR